MDTTAKKRAVVGIVVLASVAVMIVASSWQVGAAADPQAGRKTATTASATRPADVNTGRLRTPWESSVDSCPYTYNFDYQGFYSTKSQCESAGAEWCPGRVGYECNNNECESGSRGECSTAVVSVFFECYYVGEPGWVLTCKCFCWVVKK